MGYLCMFTASTSSAATYVCNYQLKIEDPSSLNTDDQESEDEISEPDEDTLAGQMAVMRGGAVKKRTEEDEQSDEESSTDDDESNNSSDSDSDDSDSD